MPTEREVDNLADEVSGQIIELTPRCSEEQRQRLAEGLRDLKLITDSVESELDDEEEDDDEESEEDLDDEDDEDDE